MANSELQAGSVFSDRSLGVVQAVCEEHGEYDSEGIRFAGRDVWGGCPACLDRKSRADFLAEQERQSADRRAAVLRNAFGRACIPPRFQGKTFETYLADTEQKRHALAVCKAFAELFEETRSSAPSLILCGRPGTGKTHLACAIADSLIHNGYSAVFSRVFDAIRTIKSTWDRKAEMSETQAIRSFVEPDLLILDEVGVQFGSEAETLLLFEILNGRYEAIKSTILISNLPIGELKNFIGERVMDRLREGGGKYIAFDWDSFRASA